MLVIAFITSASAVKKILEHLHLPTAPPRLLPPRRFWEEIPDDHVPVCDDLEREDIDI